MIQILNKVLLQMCTKVCARLAQLVRSLTANHKVLDSISGLVKSWTLLSHCSCPRADPVFSKGGAFCKGG